MEQEVRAQKKKMIILIVAVVVVVLVGLTLFYCIMARHQQGRFPANTTINGIDVSGMTAERAKDELANQVEFLHPDHCGTGRRHRDHHGGADRTGLCGQRGCWTGCWSSLTPICGSSTGSVPMSSPPPPMPRWTPPRPNRWFGG